MQLKALSHFASVAAAALGFVTADAKLRGSTSATVPRRSRPTGIPLISAVPRRGRPTGRRRGTRDERVSRAYVDVAARGRLRRRVGAAGGALATTSRPAPASHAVPVRRKETTVLVAQPPDASSVVNVRVCCPLRLSAARCAEAIAAARAAPLGQGADGRRGRGA